MNTNLRLRLGLEDINVTKEVKFFGLDLNYILTLTNLVDKIVKKNIKSNFIVYLYKRMVRPLYIYANANWANVTKTDLKMIQKEQNKAIRLAYNLLM